MKGILFKPDMVRAIMGGTKTVTRRLSGLEEINKTPDAWNSAGMVVPPNDRARFQSFHGDILIVKPRYLPGHTYYVKEAWYIRGKDVETGKPLLAYKLDDPVLRGIFGYKSPLFMPAWAARYFITMTDVRPERLQVITEEGAIAEGIRRSTWEANIAPYRAYIHVGVNAGRSLAVAAYMDLWDSINKKPGTRWVDNPWVWRYKFKLSAETR